MEEFPGKAPKKITRLINEGARVCTATTPRALRAMVIGYLFLEFSHFLRAAFVRGVTVSVRILLDIFLRDVHDKKRFLFL